MRVNKFLILFLIFTINTTTVFAINESVEKPSYEIIITSEKTTFNPGEEAKFYGYITGFGDTQRVKMALYTTRKIEILNLTMTNVPQIPQVAYGAAVFEGGGNLKEQVVLGNTILASEGSLPISATILVPESMESGVYTIKVVLSYNDMEGNWYTSEDVLEFYVTTWYERHEMAIQIVLAFSILLIGIFLGEWLEKRKHR